MVSTYPPKRLYKRYGGLPLRVKVQLSKNRVKALEYEIKKKETMINELNHFIRKFEYEV